MLSLCSPIWGLCVYAVAFITASALIAFLPYCSATSQNDTSRFAQIDGLRGYLALGVFLTHAVTVKHWLEFGGWGWPPSSFFTMAGTVPVSIFFMITAFLFWGKAIKAQGRIKPYSLLRSRLRRLAPLYLSTVPLLLFFVGVDSHWTLRTDLSSLFFAIGRWSLLGLGGYPHINGVTVLYPQIWTLAFEWAFYAALPFIAFLWRPPGGITIVIFLVVAQYWHLPPILLNFAVGIVVAELVAFRPDLNWIKTWWATLVAIIVLTIPGVMGDGEFSWKITACATPLFICVCYGNGIFGFLSNGAARLLGSASYSTYLVHVFLLQFFVLIVGHFVQIGSVPPYLYWLMIFILTAILVTVSVITFRFIEQPWLSKLRTNDKGSYQLLSRIRTTADIFKYHMPFESLSLILTVKKKPGLFSRE